MDTNDLYPRSSTLFAAVCALIFAVIGILGNLLTILALLKNSKLKGQSTTIFIISLSLSDFICCAFTLPLQSLRYYHQRWIFGVLLCKAFPIVLYFSIGVSLFNMVAITINRLILLAYNRLYAKIYNLPNILLQLFLVWLIPFMVLLPAILGVYGTTGLDEKTFSCTILKKDGKSIKKMLFIIGFLVPCSVIILSYLCIYIKFLRKRKNQRNQAKFAGSTLSVRNSQEEDNKLTVMMVARFICFIVCFLPLMLANVFDNEGITKYPWFHIIATVMAWASTVINPIIYAVSNQNYRIAYYEIVMQLKFWGEPLPKISSSGTQYSADFSGAFHQYTSVNGMNSNYL